MKKRPLRPGTQVQLWAACDACTSLLWGIWGLGTANTRLQGTYCALEGLTVCQVPVVAPDKPSPSDPMTTLGVGASAIPARSRNCDRRLRLARSCTLSAVGRAGLAPVCVFDP